MKHNPRLNEKVAALPGHARLHPAQNPKRAQGALELMWNLERALSEICGLPHVSLQPSAGSHGELAGLLLTRAYHEDRGEERTQGAHARHLSRHQPGDGDDGRLRGGQGRDQRARRGRSRRPARQGRGRRRLPDAHQPEHARALRREHRRDRRDRARRRGDPLLRRRQPQRDHGLHAARATWASTSSTSTSTSRSASRTAAAARGRDRSPSPTASRRSCRSRASSATRPATRTTARARASTSTTIGQKSIGRLRGFQGNFGVFVRSYAYISSLGGDGLHEASETAVLNANYLLAKLREGRAGKYLPLAFDRTCMHEFVLSGAAAKRDLGVTHSRHRQAAARLRLSPADDLLPAARRRGAHGRADGDRDARGARRRSPTRSSRSWPRPRRIRRSCASAPYTTPVRRLDEAAASRKPKIRA